MGIVILFNALLITEGSSGTDGLDLPGCELGGKAPGQGIEAGGVA
jgi:hypothetical protein